MAAAEDPTAGVLAVLNPAFSLLGGSSLGALPKGIRKNHEECVVARAFEQATGRAVLVYGDCVGVYFRDDARAISRTWHGRAGRFEKGVDQDGTRVYFVDLPLSLKDFIAVFDDMGYPELIDFPMETFIS